MNLRLIFPLEILCYLFDTSISYFIEIFWSRSRFLSFFSVFRRGRRIVENNECGQRYSCPRCYSSFSKKGNMLTHFRHECGKEPRFQCPYCGKKDRKSSNTYRHIRLYHKGSNIHAFRLYWTRKSALTTKLMSHAENKRHSVNWIDLPISRSSPYLGGSADERWSADQTSRWFYVTRGICIAESLFLSYLRLSSVDIEFLVDIGIR